MKRKQKHGKVQHMLQCVPEPRTAAIKTKMKVLDTGYCSVMFTARMPRIVLRLCSTEMKQQQQQQPLRKYTCSRFPFVWTTRAFVGVETGNST